MTESGRLVEGPHVKTGCLTREHDPLSGRVNTHVNKSGTAELSASSLNEAKLFLFITARIAVTPSRSSRERERHTKVLFRKRSYYVRRKKAVCHNGR